MAVAFAAKLRLAAATLGCSSRKEFCARFRRVNPATQCDIDRLNKWVQGRSLPRASSVYADFAGVIGSPQSGRWVADCSLEEFAAELTARTGVDAATLATPDSLSPRGNPRATGLFGGVAMLTGTYAALFARVVATFSRPFASRRIAAFGGQERQPDRELFRVADRPGRAPYGGGDDPWALHAFRAA